MTVSSTSANIGNVGDVELTQMGTFTGEIDKSTMERIPNVSYKLNVGELYHKTRPRGYET